MYYLFIDIDIYVTFLWAETEKFDAYSGCAGKSARPQFGRGSIPEPLIRCRTISSIERHGPLTKIKVRMTYEKLRWAIYLDVAVCFHMVLYCSVQSFCLLAGVRFNIKTISNQYRNSRSGDKCRIFTMAIHIHGKNVFILRRGPGHQVIIFSFWANWYS